MKKLAFPAAALALFLLAGCKSATVAGTYTFEKTTLDLKDDKSFTLGQSDAPQGNLQGKWSEQADKVVLNGDTVGGKPIDDLLKGLEKMGVKGKPLDDLKTMLTHMEATENADKTTLTISMPAVGRQSAKSVTLTKSK